MAALLRHSATLSGRWAQEAHRIEDRYPGFEFVPRPARLDLIALHQTPTAGLEATECDNPVKAWRGTIRPFASDASDHEVTRIIADLAADRDVGLWKNGTLAHLETCPDPHDLPAELMPARRLTDAYTIELACRIPPGLPVVRAINPLIFPEASVLVDGRPIVEEPFRPPHLQWREGALCITFPPDRTWQFGEGVLADFLDQTAIWLAKHTVWCESRERLGSGNGIWIGRATTHDEFSVFDRLDELSERDPCHCGRAEHYGECCRPKELSSARDLVLSVVRTPWLNQLRTNLNRFKVQYRPHVMQVLATSREMDRVSS